MRSPARGGIDQDLLSSLLKELHLCLAEVKHIIILCIFSLLDVALWRLLLLIVLISFASHCAHGI